MPCHDERAEEGKRPAQDDARRRTVLNWLGLSCVGFCVLGVPLLGLALSAAGLSWVEHGWLAWTLLGLSLVLYGTSLVLSFRHHRSRGPILLALVGAGALIAHAAHAAPAWTEWAGLAALLGAWFWDRGSHRRAHQRGASSELVSRSGNSAPVGSARRR